LTLPERRDNAKDLHDRIVATMQLIRASFFDLHDLLMEFNTGKFYYVFGYNSMREYIQMVSGYKDRMSFHIQKLLENQALSEYVSQHREEAEAIGQSKLIALAESGQVNENNIQEMVNMASQARTVRDLQDALSVNTDHQVHMSIAFLSREDWEFVKTTMGRVKERMGVDNNGRVVVMAFQEIISSHPEWFEEA